jgi:hypothetical protein
MSIKKVNDILQVVEAANQRAAEEWKLWLYSRETDKLVIWSSMVRGGRHAYLVFRSPRYVRFEAAISTPGFVAGEQARQMIQSPPPTTVLAEPSNLILAFSGGTQFYVVCESAAFYEAKWQDSWLSSSRTQTNPDRQPTAAGERSNRVVDKLQRCGEIQGANLHWEGLHVSHTALILTAKDLPVGPRALRFHLTEYVDCPTTMSRAHLRLASRKENEALRARVSTRLASWFEPPLSTSECGMTPTEGHLVIECDEGVFSIWAGALFLSWYDQWDGLHHLPPIDPLWRGGPPLAEL